MNMTIIIMRRERERERAVYLLGILLLLLLPLCYAAVTWIRDMRYACVKGDCFNGETTLLELIELVLEFRKIFKSFYRATIRLSGKSGTSDA